MAGLGRGAPMPSSLLLLLLLLPLLAAVTVHGQFTTGSSSSTATSGLTSDPALILQFPVRTLAGLENAPMPLFSALTSAAVNAGIQPADIAHLEFILATDELLIVLVSAEHAHALATYLIYAQGLFVVPNGQQNPILATVTQVLNAPTTTTTTTSTLSCSERLSALPPTDVLLILDSSSSADVTSWSQIVDFARQLVSALSASTGAATNLHFAVMQYARQRKVLHDWTASAGAIDAALLAAPHLNQADTRLFKALQFATDSLLVPLFNPLRRSKVPAVAILITLSDAPPALLSSNVIPLLHAQLQTMTVVGVGSGVVSAANLAQLAKPVSSVELVTKANKLSSTLLAVLTHAFCPRPPPPPTSTTRNLPGSFYTTTAQRPTTTTTTWETRPTTTTATETRPTTATTTERRERTTTTTIHRETTTAGGTTTTTTTSTTAAAPSTLAPFINPSSDPNGNDDAIALAAVLLAMWLLSALALCCPTCFALAATSSTFVADDVETTGSQTESSLISSEDMWSEKGIPMMAPQISENTIYGASTLMTTRVPRPNAPVQGPPVSQAAVDREASRNPQWRPRSASETVYGPKLSVATTTFGAAGSASAVVAPRSGAVVGRSYYSEQQYERLAPVAGAGSSSTSSSPGMGAPVVVSPLKRNSRISIQSPSSLSPQPSVTEMERRLSVLDDRRTVLEHELADAIAHHGADSVTAASKRAMLDVVNESRRATALELSRLRGEGETVA